MSCSNARRRAAGKNHFIREQRAPWTIIRGPFRGIRMNLNLGHQMLLYVGLFEGETYPWVERLPKGTATAVDIERACIESLKLAGFKSEVIRNDWWRAIIPEQCPIPHNQWLVAWK